MSDSKLIARNTIYLYIRMGLMMLVSLYASRIVLQKLGVDDYGVYNVIGSFILTFSFVSGPLGAATQRFLNFEIGKGNSSKANLIFYYCLILYLVLSLLLFAAIFTVGIWFIDNKMSVPFGRVLASKYVLLFSLVAAMINLVRTPFDSLVFAYEKMGYYAIVSIMESLLVLASVISLSFITYDKLIYYALCQVMISLSIICCIFIYCRKSFSLKFEWKWDGLILSRLLKFSGWSFLGALASVASTQFLNILINVYVGVAYNAAMGIAMQLSGAVNKFASNFQLAFRPQIVKSFSLGEMSALRLLVQNSSKYSYLLLFAFICPICINAPFLLHAWLGEFPPIATEFTICLLVYVLLESLSAPMWMAVQATGEIRNYQIVISCTLFLNVVLSILLLQEGFAPVFVLVVKCLVDVMCLIIRIKYISKLIGFSIKGYVRDVLIPIGILSVVCFVILGYGFLSMDSGLHKFFLSTLTFILIFVPFSYNFVLKSSEKRILKLWILKNKYI